MAYQYRGSNHDVEPGLVLTAIPTTDRRRKSFDPAKCGTKAGFRSHQNHGVDICNDCRQAQADYMRNYHRARKQVAA